MDDLTRLQILEVSVGSDSRIRDTANCCGSGGNCGNSGSSSNGGGGGGCHIVLPD